MATDNAVLESALTKLYGLQRPVIVERAKGGYAAESFIIEDGDTKFFVKKYLAKRTPERLLEVHRVKKFFNEHGVPTIPPLSNVHGSTLSEIDGMSFAVFPYVSEKLYHTLPGDKAVASAGENLAKLHLAGADHLSLVRGKVFKPWDTEDFLKRARHMLELAGAGTSAFDIMAREMLELKMQLARNSTLRYEDLSLKTDTILHGDYHYHNLFFDTDDNVSHTFDFERTMVGPRTTDVAYALFMISFDLNTETHDDVSEVHFRKAEAFTRAYNKTFPIGEQDFLNGLRWYFWSQMVYIEWPFGVHYFDGDTRADGLLAKRFNRLKYFAKHLDATLLRVKEFKA